MKINVSILFYGFLCGNGEFDLSKSATKMTQFERRLLLLLRTSGDSDGRGVETRTRTCYYEISIFRCCISVGGVIVLFVVSCGF